MCQTRQNTIYFNVYRIHHYKKLLQLYKTDIKFAKISNLKCGTMSLFPDDDILIREIESWKGFADMLCSADRGLFLQMLNDCHRYITP